MVRYEALTRVLVDYVDKMDMTSAQIEYPEDTLNI